MASAGNGLTLTTSEEVLYDNRRYIDGGAEDYFCTGYLISSRSTNSAIVLVNIDGLHANTDWIGIPPGLSIIFRCNVGQSIRIVNVKTASSTAVIDYGIVEKMKY